MLGDERIVVEPGIRATDAIDLVGLARRELFMRVEAPGAAQQALTAEYFMDAWNAPAEGVRDVEDRAIRIGKGGGLGEHSGVEDASGALSLRAFQQLYRRSGPAGPLAKQTAVDPPQRSLAADRDGERCQQIDDDVVVVARVERDVVTARIGDGTDHVDRLIPVEGRDLDRPDVRQLGELAPKGVAENATADRGLEVEAEERHHLTHLAAMQQQLAFVLTLPVTEAEQGNVIA